VLQTTADDADTELNNTGPLGGPVIILCIHAFRQNFQSGNHGIGDGCSWHFGTQNTAGIAIPNRNGEHFMITFCSSLTLGHLDADNKTKMMDKMHQYSYVRDDLQV